MRAWLVGCITMVALHSAWADPATPTTPATIAQQVNALIPLVRANRLDEASTRLTALEANEPIPAMIALLNQPKLGALREKRLPAVGGNRLLRWNEKFEVALAGKQSVLISGDRQLYVVLQLFAGNVDPPEASDSIDVGSTVDGRTIGTIHLSADRDRNYEKRWQHIDRWLVSQGFRAPTAYEEAEVSDDELFFPKNALLVDRSLRIWSTRRGAKRERLGTVERGRSAGCNRFRHGLFLLDEQLLVAHEGGGGHEGCSETHVLKLARKTLAP